MYYKNTISPKLTDFYKISDTGIVLIRCIDGNYYTDFNKFKPEFIRAKFQACDESEWNKAKEILLEQVVNY